MPQDPAFGAVVEQIATGGTGLLEQWPEWPTNFVDFMVCEFGAGERVLEDFFSKANPNSNGEFSKVGMTLENAETPVFEYNMSGHPWKARQFP